MAKNTHWLNVIADEIKQRMAASIDDIAAGVLGDAPFGEPPIKADAGEFLPQFLQASPENRHAFLSSIPPDKYAEVTGQLMDEATKRYGAAASSLMPLFQGGEALSSLEQLGAQQVQPNLGTAAAFADLTDLLGVDPFGSQEQT